MDRLIDRDVQYYLRTGNLREHAPEPRFPFSMSPESNAILPSGFGSASVSTDTDAGVCPPDILAEIENELDLFKKGGE